MNLLPFYVIEALDAAQLRDATAGRTNRIEPRLIIGGPAKGKYAIPTRVRDDSAYSDLKAVFAVMPEVALDADLAWPQDDDA